MSLTLEPYQEEGARFCAARPASMLLDEPGLGKTPQAVRWLDLTGSGTAYVLTTASHVYGFAQEVRDWQGFPRTVAVDDPRADVCVTTHGRVARWGFDAMPVKNALIVDEAHYLKEPDAQRTQAVYGPGCGRGQGLAGRIDNAALLMSGSMTPNYASELWTHMHRFWPGLIRTGRGMVMTPDQFAQRFTAGQRDRTTGRWKPRYNRNVDELKALLASIAIGRTHEDVGNQMPPARIRDVPMASDLEDFLSRNPAEAAELRKELDAISRFILMRRAAGASGARILADALDETDLHTATLRRLMANAKVDGAVRYAKHLLASGVDKLLIFGVHSAALARIVEATQAFQPATVTGSTPKKKRKAEADRFQTDPRCRLFVGNVQAAGEAITLTAANRVVMLESTWSPKDDMQVIARARRYGQTKTVMADYLTIPCAIEELVVQVNRRKARGNKALWG